MNNDFDELDRLQLDWELDSLSDEGAERLRIILKTNEEARKRFLQMQAIIAAMHVDSDAGLESQILSPELTPDRFVCLQHELPTKRSSRRRPPAFVTACVATMAAVLFGGILLFQNLNRSSMNSVVDSGNATKTDSEEATAHGVALLTRLADVTWFAGQPALEPGVALKPGRFSIASGHAQIEFFCGATLVVEGPAELDIASATQAKVFRGRLRANVPPAARGFTLEVEDLKVVDLGTEFGLSVSPEEPTVQVFDGEVELQRNGDKQVLTSGDAVSRSPGGEYRQVEAAPQAFVDIEQLQARFAAEQSARYERWRTSSSRLRNDQRLITYYAFDQEGDWRRRLACSKTPIDRELDGAIVGASEVSGRWNAKRALKFKLPGDRVRVQVPGEFSALTLCCWVQIDSLDRWYNSLFLTDGYEKGEPHWQILENGQVYFSVRPTARGEEGPSDFKALSPSFWRPTMNGKWIHLAVTCDATTNTIAHYLNGDVLSRHNVPAAQMPRTIKIGPASIGNWAEPTMPDAEFAIRNLNGSIDELAVFGAALSENEVMDIYRDGKP